ncbi:MAG TPA: sulfite exporter TauE/SafE family protein [Brachybacterium paraconglomeratum]|uniref:Probable membrane transporter protein n=1 Tax=Brachybacterium paraconglomeratum TaxID=173362 RepID=A0A921GP25_9MICO|nr:sulfite exporter TauE/SafE family protein [Brachybacterium paraconglomeratum]
MTPTLALTLLLAVLIGVSLGLLGGGGSILTVPILAYVAGLPAKEAIATSLVVVGVTSAAGAVSHARAGRVRWRTGVSFGAAGMAGAFLGGILGGHIPSTVMMVAFALMMIATSVGMLRGRRGAPAEEGPTREPSVSRIVLEGLAVGLVTGLVGAGGGFLVVPALALLAGLPMPVAVGTSLVVIAMKSFAGLAGYLTSVSLDWVLVGGVTLAAVLGSLPGARAAGHLPERALRTGFGVFVLAMGALVLVQELPGTAGAVAIGVVALLALLAVGCWTLVSSCPLRTARPASHTPRGT